MGAFVEQLERFGATLAHSQSETDGGWPHDLHEPDAALSIASTAHAIDMLRFLGRPYAADNVSDGLGYLSTQVHTQLRPGRRGPYNRYASYALWGLTRYREAAADRAWTSAFDFCLRWLEDNRRPGGGWATKVGGSEQLSLVATTPAVTALDRLAFDQRFGPRASVLSGSARRAIVEQGLRRAAPGPLVWGHGSRSGPAPGPTALAALALAGSPDPLERDEARASARWLLDRSGHWAGTVEADLLLTQVHWRVLTFSLGVRAVLAAGAAGPADRRLQPALSALAPLWDPSTDAWAVQPGELGSTTGSFGVVSAVRAATRHWRFDPFDGLPVTFARPSRRRPPVRRRHLLRLHAGDRMLEVREGPEDALIVSMKLPPQLMATLAFAARRHCAGAEAESLTRRSFTLRELADALDVQPDSARRYLGRINALVEERWLTRVIEDVDLPSEAAVPEAGRRYAVDAYDVELLP